MKGFMQKVTLSTLLAVIEKNEAKNDDRFQLVKQDLESMRFDFDSEFKSVRSEFTSLRSELHSKFSEIDKRFDKQDRTLELIATQTAKTMNVVSDHEIRIRKLEATAEN
jgi:hypothetical protein